MSIFEMECVRCVNDNQDLNLFDEYQYEFLSDVRCYLQLYDVTKEIRDSKSRSYENPDDLTKIKSRIDHLNIEN